MPLGRKKCFPEAYCCTNYGSVYVSSRCQQKAVKNNLVFMNMGDSGELWPLQAYTSTQLSCETARKRAREREESVQNEWRWAVFPFFSLSLSLSTLRSKWSKANKTERGRIRREGKLLWTALIPDCTVIASRAPFLSLSPLQPVTDDTAPVRNLGDSLQEHIHLRPNSSRP